MTTPRGHKAEGVVFEDDVKVCGISVASKVDVQKGLQTVLHGALPFEAPLGDIIVGTTPKGDIKVSLSVWDRDCSVCLRLLSCLVDCQVDPSRRLGRL